ncbi:MAG: membrane protein insertase YidC, partial [Cyanobacteria bacterium CAN_BIN43]|nr:membrane protein insertase YidC [Cyanobacteria bacterium CAN_BIN43]
MYMVIANIFQTLQTFILSKEALPENLQKIVDADEKKKAIGEDRPALPFEPKTAKKEEAPKNESGGVDKTSKKNNKKG